jgi:chromosome segregation ATPase
MLNHGCMQSCCPGCVRDDASHQCNCEWTCRCHECRDDREGQNYVFDKDYEKILWEKNNFIAEQQVDLDRMPKKHQENLAFFRDMYKEDAGCAVQDNIRLNVKLVESNEKLAEYDKKLIESDKKLTEYDKKLIESDKKLAEYDKKLIESYKKLTEIESSLDDYHVQVRCKNEELDDYNLQVKSLDKKHMESEKKLANSEARLIACRGEVHAKGVANSLLRTKLDQAEDMRGQIYQKWHAAVANVKSLTVRNSGLLKQIADGRVAISDAMRAQEPDTKRKKEM